MNTEKECTCKGGPKLIFSCSGAADVGEIADLVARQLTKDGDSTMFCLAGIGGRVDPIMKTTREASQILAIDGCSLDCVKKTLESAGFGDLIHIRVTDLGYDKGSSPATPESLADVANKIKRKTLD